MTPLVSSACTQIYLHGCTKFMFAVLGGVCVWKKLGSETKLGKYFRVLPIFLGYLARFLMVSGSDSSKELKNTIKS